MKTKSCFRCREHKPVEEFYVHAAMSDGRLNKCKACCRADAIANRNKRIDYYRDYDRMRTKTEERRLKCAAQLRLHRRRNPLKTAARAAVSRAVMSGALVRGPCEVCGCKQVDGHHDDYSRPLDVRWLCRVHHLMAHGRYQTN
jgi:hypothetical protein